MSALNFDKFLEMFDLDLQKNERFYYGACPVHDGDNTTAFNLNYTEPHKGYWICWTHHCEENGGTFLDLVKVLFRKKYGSEIFDYQAKQIMGIIDQDLPNIKFDDDKRMAIYYSRLTDKKRDDHPRYSLHSKIQIPSEYFVKRGYTPEILRKFKVGNYINGDSMWSNRAIVPVYYCNEIAFLTGRSVFPLCGLCKHWHEGECSTETKHKSKWVHSAKAKKAQFLYNYSQKPRETVNLVESPGNVWKLAQNGVSAMGIFGTSLTAAQFELLNKIGVLNINLILDNDEAGQKAMDKISKRFSSFFNIKKVKLPAEHNDLSDMSDSTLQSFIIPQLR